MKNLPEFLTRDSDGFIRLKDHRIGLEDVVYFYNEGYSPEMLLGQYPTLTLPLIYKVIAYYLENQGEVDEYIQQDQVEIEQQRAEAAKGPDLDELRQRMKAMQRAEAS